MSDFLGDDFTSSLGAGGGDDFDFDRAASAFPDISLDGDGDVLSVPATSSGFDGFNGSGGGYSFEYSPPTEVKVTGDDEFDKFESEFPELDVPQQAYAPPPSQPTFGAPPPFAPRPQPSTFSSTPILSQHPPEEEPEVIVQWREAQAEEIKARDEASRAKRQETISRAEGAIDEFYEEYNAKKEKTISDNKAEEAVLVSTLTDSLSHGTTWDRICDLIDLQNSQSKTNARTGAGTTDLSRFREVLLRLKREGENAPGAAGY